MIVDGMSGGVEAVGSLAGRGVVVLAGVAISGGLALSRLGGGDADIDGVRIGDSGLSGFVSKVLFRPQNDNNPPPVFFPFPVSATPCVTASFPPSTTRQPTGKSSCTTSQRDLTDVSHAVEPFDAISCDIGLSRVTGRCLLTRIDSAMCLAVKVLPNGIVGGRVISSGTMRATREGLCM